MSSLALQTAPPSAPDAIENGVADPLRTGRHPVADLRGAALVLAIALGTAYLAMQFRERTIEVAEREDRHRAIAVASLRSAAVRPGARPWRNIIAYIRAGGVDTPDAFEKQMSLLSTHETPRSRLAALPHVGALKIFNKEGWLINSSEDWPVPDIQIGDRRYFREFTSGQPTPDVIVEPVEAR